MKVIEVSAPTEIGQTVLTQVKGEIEEALRQITTAGREFVVNDTKWFQQQNSKISPTVMNSANFMTKAVAKNLTKLGWQTEPTLHEQRIDGFEEFEGVGGFGITREGFLEMVSRKWDEGQPDEVPNLASELIRKYFSRNCFRLTPDLDLAAEFFTENDDRHKVRIGFEFETGNIASSFRALSKLDSLYKLDSIDIGVFVTSIDKETTAARIWPSSNRNGSFEELNNRGYKGNVEIPLIEFGFAPDRLDSSAPYLGADGKVFTPVSITEQVTVAGQDYCAYKAVDGRKVLLPKDASTELGEALGL